MAERSPFVRYKLGAKHGGRYFTKREAECMACLLKGKTIANVAAILKLSPRTVEYYIKNMKAKLLCRTKFELIDLVRASEFMENLELFCNIF
ncbi:MAG: helix-turn-helix transcriptional regulator [bacterium]